MLDVDGREEALWTELIFVSRSRYQLEELGLDEQVGCIDSGRLAIFVTRALSPRALLALSARAALGKLAAAPTIDAGCASELTVRLARRRVRVATDGEVVMLLPPLRFAVRRDAVQVIVPGERAA